MNVVLVGECGTGKSSLINLMMGRDTAKTSNDTTACTTHAQSYQVSINGCDMKLWDTPGLDEGSSTRANARSSETLAKSLLRLKGKGDIHLVLYCMHGNRAKSALLKHYEIIRSLVHPDVPIVAVVTRLERYQGHMEDWWSNNSQELAKYGVNFTDHACVTTIPDSNGLPTAFRERLIYSQGAVRDLIRRNSVPQLSSIKVPAIPFSLHPAIYGYKESEDARLQTLSLQTSSCRMKATINMRMIPTALFA